MKFIGYLTCLNGRALRVAAIALALATAGCASGSQEGADLMPGTNETGYYWVGTGERGNFASAYSLCRQTLQRQTMTGPSANFDQRSAAAVTFNTPDTTVTGAPSASSYPARRSFESCMRSQGWAIADQAPPASPAPAAPAMPPSPTNP